MDHSKVATPPSTPSRSSTAFDGSERDTTCSQTSDTVPMLGGVKSAVGATGKPVMDFKPLQMLMETPWSIEYGKNLVSKLTIHEEMLRCHSKAFEKLCATAKPLQERYVKCRDLMASLGSCGYPEVTQKQFKAERMERMAIPLIQKIYENYPLQGRQNDIKTIVDKAVDEEIEKKNFKPKPTTENPRSKDTRDMSRSVGLSARLTLLKSGAVMEVAAQLYARLHQISKDELKKAESDINRAAAQQRILLPTADEGAVHSLVNWVYQGALYTGDAAELYTLMNLASELGVNVLNELCLSKLANGVFDSIQQANAWGVPFRNLLGHGPDLADPFLDTVFIKVFNDSSPPGRLLKLVIDALAENMDTELWPHVRQAVSHEMALQLIDAMVLLQQIKNEKCLDQTSVKSEGDDAALERASNVVNKAQRSKHRG